MNYTDKQINDFLELAQDVGITKAKRELGYPKGWDTARRWAEVRQIEVAVDEVKARARAMQEFYKDEEVITIAQEGMNRVYDELVNNNSLTADDQNKLARALKTHYDVWAGVQGRATSINETRSTDGMDAGLIALLDEERRRNLEQREEADETA